MFNPATGIRIFPPAGDAIIDELDEYINDESLIRFYRYTSGCILRNDYGEIHIYPTGKVLDEIKGKASFIGLVPVGFIKDEGDLFLDDNGAFFLYGKDSSVVRKRWDNIEALLNMRFG